MIYSVKECDTAAGKRWAVTSGFLVVDIFDTMSEAWRWVDRHDDGAVSPSEDRHQFGWDQSVARHFAKTEAAPALRREDVAAEIIAKMTPKGAWTRKTLASWGVPWPPPHGWRRQLEQHGFPYRASR